MNNTKSRSASRPYTPECGSSSRMAERRPVQTSAVFLLNSAQFAAVPPPSPPSPVTPGEEGDLCSPIEELSLDDAAVELGAATPDSGIEADVAAVVTSSAAAATANSTTTNSINNPNNISSSPSTDPLYSDRLAGAIHVLSTEATALQSVTHLYATSRAARDGFNAAVEAITRMRATQPQGKIVVVGVGKSGYIGRKLAATFNSLAVQASFLHPTEALHGDLGHVGPHDTLLFITYSGKTQELISLVPHLDPGLTLILLTSHVTAETCELVRHRPDTILLPAPVHEEEKVSFGVSAPTTSTTMALAVGDALAIVASKELHSQSVGSVFRRNHPGGAIGEALRPGPTLVRHLVAARWCDMPTLRSITTTTTTTSSSSPSSSSTLASSSCLLGADVLRAGYDSHSGWVRVDDDGVVTPARIRALRSADLARPLRDIEGLVARRAEFVALAADTQIRSAAGWLRAAAREDEEDREEEEEEADGGGGGGTGDDDDVVVAVLEHGDIVGVLELRELLEHGE